MCEHEWEIHPYMPFPFLKCKKCGILDNIMNIPDEEIKKSLGDKADFVLKIKNIGLETKNKQEEV